MNKNVHNTSDEYFLLTCEEYLALPPLLPPEVIALLLPWLPVDRPDDRQEELEEQVDHTGFHIFPTCEG